MPTAAEGATGRRLALVVATGTYADPALAKLRAPGRDATDLAAVLADVAVGGFEVETVLDAPTEELRRSVAQFCAEIGPSDLALVYLSCHGVLDDRGRLYYATSDTDRTLLSATAVSSAWLNEQLEDSRGRRQILVLDCCHSGAFARGAKGEDALALGQRFEGRGRVVLTGSRGTEYSFEHDHDGGDGASSVFTGSLVEGLRSGEADRDGDGLITVNELYEYAYDAVRAREARQTPTLWTYGAEGDLLVARSPRGAAAEPVPPPPAPASPSVPPPPPPQMPPAPAGPRSPRRRPLVLAAAATLALAIAGLAVGLIAGGESGAPAPDDGVIAVGGAPAGIAVSDGTAWVARYGAGKVDRINPSGDVEGSATVGPRPEKVVAGEGWVWVSYDEGRGLAQIDPESLEVEQVELAGDDSPVKKPVIAEGKLWAAAERRRGIIAFDVETRERIPTEYKPGPGFGLVFDVGGGTVWAVGTDETDDRAAPFSWLNRLDPVSGEKQQRSRTPVGVEAQFEAIAYSPEMVWISDSEEGHDLVYPFDPDKDAVVEPIKIGSGVTSDDLEVAGDTVLVWDADAGVLTYIDAKQLAFEDQREPAHGYDPGEALNHRLSDLTVGEGLAWITDPAGGKVHKVEL